MSVKVQIVTVVNKPSQYARYVKNNPFYKDLDLVSFDNTNQNIPITARYNDFLDNRMLPDAWVIFCHQDFSINEDVSLKLKDLDKGCIYGPIGIKACRSKALSFRLTGPKALTLRKRVFFERKWHGQILQGLANDESKSILIGEKSSGLPEVDTLDSCCFIVHSSLMRKYGVRFDTNLDFNLFAADLSIMARKLYKIKTKILQMDCFHLSRGVRSAGYYRCLSYLISKYPEEHIALTFSGGEEMDAFKYFISHKNSHDLIRGLVATKGDL